MRPLVYAPFLAAALLLGWHYLTPEAPAPELAPDPLATTAAATEDLPVFIRPADKRLPAPPAASLQGTQVDGMLEVDRNGNLVVSEQLRHLFDYFYTAVGEISFDQASGNIRQHLASQLQQPALAQALELLDDYIEYKTALVELEQSFPVTADIQALRSRADAVQRLRATIFSAQAHQAFFAAEEVFNAFTLERLAIMHDDNIPAADKAAMIEDLRLGLPEEMQDLLVPQIHQVLTEQTRSLQEDGADPAQIRDLRLSLVGPEATERLESLDAQRQQWQQRLDEFSAERRAIVEQTGLAEADKQRAIEELAAQRFAPNERLRLASLLENPGEPESGTP